MAKQSWEQADFAAISTTDWAIRNAVAIGQNRGFMWFQEMDFMAFVTLMEDLRSDQ